MIAAERTRAARARSPPIIHRVTIIICTQAAPTPPAPRSRAAPSRARTALNPLLCQADTPRLRSAQSRARRREAARRTCTLTGGGLLRRRYTPSSGRLRHARNLLLTSSGLQRARQGALLALRKDGRPARIALRA